MDPHMDPHMDPLQLGDLKSAASVEKQIAFSN